MFKFKKNSLYQFFPIISVICLFLAKLYEDNFYYMNPNRIFEYAYFNILYQGALLFFIAYLIPLFLSLKIGGNVKRILIIGLIFFVICYILISSYFFFFKRDSILLTNNYDVLLGILGGVLLGSTSASSYKKIITKEKKL